MPLNGQAIAKMAELKQKCGMSNKDLAAVTGMAESTVQRYLTGAQKDPPIENVRALIVAMGGDPDDILGTKLEAQEDVYIPAMPQASLTSQDRAMYEHMILAMEERHRAEIERINRAHERAREALIADHREAIKEKKRWQIAHVIIIGVLVTFIMVLFVIDILNPDVGWFQRALNSLIETKAVLELYFNNFGEYVKNVCSTSLL